MKFEQTREMQINLAGQCKLVKDVHYTLTTKVEHLGVNVYGGGGKYEVVTTASALPTARAMIAGRMAMIEQYCSWVVKVRGAVSDPASVTIIQRSTLYGDELTEYLREKNLRESNYISLRNALKDVEERTRFYAETSLTQANLQAMHVVCLETELFLTRLMELSDEKQQRRELRQFIAAHKLAATPVFGASENGYTLYYRSAFDKDILPLLKRIHTFSWDKMPSGPRTIGEMQPYYERLGDLEARNAQLVLSDVKRNMYFNTALELKEILGYRDSDAQREQLDRMIYEYAHHYGNTLETNGEPPTYKSELERVLYLHLSHELKKINVFLPPAIKFYYTCDELNAMPVIKQLQRDNVLIDAGDYRLLQSRMTRRDGEQRDHEVLVQRFNSETGGNDTLYSYEPKNRYFN